jgi:hypothetical protein
MRYLALKIVVDLVRNITVEVVGLTTSVLQTVMMGKISSK